MEIVVRRAELDDCAGIWKVYRDEGTHKAHALRDGRYADSLAMARLKPKQKL